MKTQIQHLHSLPQAIQIPSHESWIILDDSNTDTEQTIVLEEWAKLDFYSARTSGILRLDIIHRGPESHSFLRCGFHASATNKINGVIKSTFEASHTTSEIQILSLADTDGEVLLDSAIDIREWVIGAVGRLKERHIFLGSGGKIRGIPALVIHSDDIEASHALAIDRISDAELFYLRSRGFTADDATGLILEGAVCEIFSGLEVIDETLCTQVKESVLRFD